MGAGIVECDVTFTPTAWACKRIPSPEASVSGDLIE
jgi:hypothetical protein